MQRKQPKLSGRLATLVFFLFSLSCFSLVTNTLDMGTAAIAASGPASPFGISGVRYPLLNNEDHAKNISYLVKSTGGSWVRGSTLIWGHIERQKGSYEWEIFDTVVRRCQADNIHLLVNLAPFAHWDQGDKRGKPKDMKAFLTFLEKLVERYDFDGTNDMPGLKEGLHYLEILNEPMAVGHFFDGDVEDFFDILRQSYPVIKKASPECKLLIAGLADIEDNNINGLPPIFSAHSLTRKYVKTYHTYYDLLHEMGVEKYYDIMNIHVYGNDLRDVVRYYQQFGKPIWITETSESPRKSPEKQAQGLIKRFVRGLSLGVDKIFWFSLINDKTMPLSGIYNESMRPRETFFAYRMLVDKLGDSNWRNVETIHTGVPHAHCYLFHNKNNHRRTWVAWSEGADSVEIQLKVSAKSEFFTVTPFSPLTTQEKENVISANLAGRTAKARHGALQISLNSNPLFIEEGKPSVSLVEIDLSRLQGGQTSLSPKQDLPAFNQHRHQRTQSPAFSPNNHNHLDAHGPPSAKRPIFGIITDIRGNKISFRSFKGESLVVFTDNNTKFTRERLYPIDSSELIKGDGAVLILRDSQGENDKQFAAIIDKLPPKK